MRVQVLGVAPPAERALYNFTKYDAKRIFGLNVSTDISVYVLVILSII